MAQNVGNPANKNVLSVRVLSAEETGRSVGKVPTKAFPGDAGFDLYPTVKASMLPGDRLLVPTGIAVAIPEGYYGRIAERSGYGSQGLGVGAGVIDSGYRGEIMVALYSRRFADDYGVATMVAIDISPEKAVAQLIIEKCDPFEVVECIGLPSADRGDGGFGSSDS